MTQCHPLATCKIFVSRIQLHAAIRLYFCLLLILHFNLANNYYSLEPAQEAGNVLFIFTNMYWCSRINPNLPGDWEMHG